MYENKKLEFKSDITNSFIKTVCAYANYEGGKIIFGIDDNGKITGIDNLDQTCLEIENKINDSIHPKPDYTFNIDRVKQTISLDVSAGRYKPYLYKGKAYKRNGTSTIEVDRIELTRLILEGQNLSFDQLDSKSESLEFNELESKLTDITKISSLSTDVKKTLQLYTSNMKYNNAAELLADSNSFPGIDIVRFGDNINIILDRETIDHKSILIQYDCAIQIFKKYYQYEEIKGIERKKVELIPEEAYREAVANALVHRTWDVNASIKISMFNDRIEVSSPGGLPFGVSEQEYLSGHVSILRNPIIGDVFYRLRYIERYGTGIIRINNFYSENGAKPKYEITENCICVTLPVLKTVDLAGDDKIVYDMLKKGMIITSNDVANTIGCGKSKATSILKKLVAMNYVEILGNGKSTKYKLK